MFSLNLVGDDDELLPPHPPTIPEEEGTHGAIVMRNDIGMKGSSSGVSTRVNSALQHSTFSSNILSTSSNNECISRSGNGTGNMYMSSVNQQHLNSSGRNNPGQHNQNSRGHIVRLNSIEPNTVMFNTKVRHFQSHILAVCQYKL